MSPDDLQMCLHDQESFRSIFGPCWHKTGKPTYYAHLSRIWKLTHFTGFIRKVFATKILLSGKFSFFCDSDTLNTIPCSTSLPFNITPVQPCFPFNFSRGRCISLNNSHSFMESLVNQRQIKISVSCVIWSLWTNIASPTTSRVCSCHSACWQLWIKELHHLK